MIEPYRVSGIAEGVWENVLLNPPVLRRRCKAPPEWAKSNGANGLSGIAEAAALIRLAIGIRMILFPISARKRPAISGRFLQLF
jgi:hypothetical protein